MAMLMQQEVLPMQQEYLGGGATPAPIPSTQPAPGTGVPSAPPPKQPAMGERSAGPTSAQPIGDAAPVPRPAAPAGPSTAPTPPSPATVTAFSSSPAYAGGGPIQIMDWQQGLGQTDRSAVTRSVQDSELTSKQLSRLLDENGRFIQNARLRAREGASSSGMLMSTLAAGAAERAAIDSALPIAQSDASTFLQTASENMRVQNEDAQADQGAGRNLFGQAMGIDAQMRDAEAGRRFSSGENAANRTFQGQMAAEDRSLTREQNEMQRELQRLMQQEGFSFQAAQSELDRRLTEDQNYLSRQQQADLESNRLAQDRFNTFVNMQGNRENQLASTLSSIFSNPNLTAQQQAAAAENARAIFASLNGATNATLSAGVPQIFARPFVMEASQPAQPTQPTQPAPLPPGSAPINDQTYIDPQGVIRRISEIARR